MAISAHSNDCLYHHVQIVPNAKEQLISEKTGLALVKWQGIYEDIEAVWLRWATLQGELLPTKAERLLLERNKMVYEKEQEHLRAEQEHL